MNKYLRMLIIIMCIVVIFKTGTYYLGFEKTAEFFIVWIISVELNKWFRS